MATVKTWACVLLFSLLLLTGCSEPTEKRVEDLEPESISKERRMKHEKLAPKEGPEGGVQRK